MESQIASMGLNYTTDKPQLKIKIVTRPIDLSGENESFPFRAN
jgi:hypothetical protein